MLRRLRQTKLWALLPLFLLVLAITSCAAKAKKGSEMDHARLEAVENKLAQLEERIAENEGQTSRINEVGRGVDLLLQKLADVDANGGDREARRKPSPTAIYSMPIDGDPFTGPKLAKVTMVKGYDFYCGYCDKVRPTLDELQNIYGKDLKVVFKNFVIHEDYARLPALAACAAHKQEKFMPIFEQIWIQGMRARHELTEDDLISMAKKIGLNMKRFNRDMRGTCEEKIRSDFESMAAVGSTGTPAFYINGRFVAGALPLKVYRRIIDQELARANREIKAGTKLKDYYRVKVVEEGLKSF